MSEIIMCPQCGEALLSNELTDHYTKKHSGRSVVTEEAEQILIADDKYKELKVKRYDKIAELIYTSSTNEVDNEFIIEPMFIVNRILKILLGLED